MNKTLIASSVGIYVAVFLKADGTLGLFDSTGTFEFVPTAVPQPEPEPDTTGDKAA